jgi:hypothetical protein
MQIIKEDLTNIEYAFFQNKAYLEEQYTNYNNAPEIIEANIGHDPIPFEVFALGILNSKLDSINIDLSNLVFDFAINYWGSILQDYEIFSEALSAGNQPPIELFSYVLTQFHFISEQMGEGFEDWVRLQ